MPFIECSARKNHNVREVFRTLLSETEHDAMFNDSSAWGSSNIGIDCDCACYPLSSCLPSSSTVNDCLSSGTQRAGGCCWGDFSGVFRDDNASDDGKDDDDEEEPGIRIKSEDNWACVPCTPGQSIFAFLASWGNTQQNRVSNSRSRNSVLHSDGILPAKPGRQPGQGLPGRQDNPQMIGSTGRRNRRDRSDTDESEINW